MPGRDAAKHRALEGLRSAAPSGHSWRARGRRRGLWLRRRRAAETEHRLLEASSRRGPSRRLPCVGGRWLNRRWLGGVNERPGRVDARLGLRLGLRLARGRQRGVLSRFGRSRQFRRQGVHGPALPAELRRAWKRVAALEAGAGRHRGAPIILCNAAGKRETGTAAVVGTRGDTRGTSPALHEISPQKCLSV
jgi:hypothetical protein